MTFKITNLASEIVQNPKQNDSQPKGNSGLAELSSALIQDFFGGSKEAYNNAMNHFKQWGNNVVAEETNIWDDYAKEHGLEEPDGPLKWR